MPNQQQIQQVMQQAQRLANELRSLANQSPDRVSRDSLTEGAHHLEMCMRECEHTSWRVQQGIGTTGFGATYGQQPFTPTGVTTTGYGTGQYGYAQTGQQYGGYGQTAGQYGGYGTTTAGGYGQTAGQQQGYGTTTGYQGYQTQR